MKCINKVNFIVIIILSITLNLLLAIEKNVYPYGEYNYYFNDWKNGGYYKM
jgi:hypothetical protein